MDGWMDGWVDGWMGVKAGLRIAYSNQKSYIKRSSLVKKMKKMNKLNDRTNRMARTSEIQMFDNRTIFSSDCQTERSVFGHPL